MIDEIAEKIIEIEKNPQYAARMIALSIPAWLPADRREDAYKIAADCVERIRPLVHGTGEQ